MKSVIITCRTILPEVSKVLDEIGCEYPVFVLDSKLHDKPDQLNSILQNYLDNLANVDRVILAMGYCGKATVGLHSNNYIMVIPRIDDCLTMFLGSQELRNAITDEEPTYFLTKGWLNSDHGIVAEYKRTVKKFGTENAQYVLDMMYGNYNRLGLIDTGIFPLEDQIYDTEIIARLINARMELYPGTVDYLKQLISGPYDDRFIIVEPYAEVKQEDFRLSSSSVQKI